MTAFTRTRGDTYPDQIQVLSDATSDPVDITGYSFLFTLDTDKAPTDSSTNVYQLTGNIVDAANGKVEFSPSAVQADLIGKYFFDIQMTDTAGKIRTIDKDKYTYTQDITKV